MKNSNRKKSTPLLISLVLSKILMKHNISCPPRNYMKSKLQHPPYPPHHSHIQPVILDQKVILAKFVIVVFLVICFQPIFFYPSWDLLGQDLFCMDLFFVDLDIGERSGGLVGTLCQGSFVKIYIFGMGLLNLFIITGPWTSRLFQIVFFLIFWGGVYGVSVKLFSGKGLLNLFLWTGPCRKFYFAWGFYLCFILWHGALCLFFGKFLWEMGLLNNCLNFALFFSCNYEQRF